MNPDGSVFSMTFGRFLFIAVWIAYSALSFFLYRWNAVRHGSAVSGPVFIVLLCLAFAGYWFALVGSPYLRPRSLYRYCGLLVLSLAGLFFSTWFWMLFALNLYGS